MNTSHWIPYCTIVTAALLSVEAGAVELVVEQGGGVTTLKVQPPGETFHTTEATVTEPNLIDVAGSELLLMHWKESVGGAPSVPHYAFSFDNGQAVERVRRTCHILKLHYAQFDPLEGEPTIPESLRADPAGQLYVVQLFTQALPELVQPITSLGAAVRGLLADNVAVVQMTPAVKVLVDGLNYVRWVGEYHPAYRLGPVILTNLECPGRLCPSYPYDIAVFEPGPSQKAVVANRIQSMGGTVDLVPSGGFLLYATLSPEQLLAAAKWDEVSSIGVSGEVAAFMDFVRGHAGGNADFVEQIQAYSGQSVSGEVLDGWLNTPHQDFQARAPILHGNQISEPYSHGTGMYGIIFGDGTGDSQARGLLPDGQGIFAPVCAINELRHFDVCDGYTGETVERSVHLAELSDPDGPYEAVFQTNSVGHAPEFELALIPYTADSQAMDDAVFQNDIVVCQAQGNYGHREPDKHHSAPEAWAKNVLSVGGVQHGNNQNKGDDRWGSASIGPAPDGRIKPDLTHFDGYVFTTNVNGGYYEATGTSASTPITCGYSGLFFQMWANALFGGDLLLDPNCDPQIENCIFTNRPHMTTTKAMLINTAAPYCFHASECEHPTNLTREAQGWGMIDAGRLYLLRDNFLVIDNESTILDLNPQTPYDDVAAYPITVEPNTHFLKVTMVYADPPGAVSPGNNTRHDLNLKVTFTDLLQQETVYWGNCGLRSKNRSSSACQSPNPSDPNVGTDPVWDTVENVFVFNPAHDGTWTVEVQADVIYQQASPNVSYALVASVDMDCNQNSVSDADDILGDVSLDCNQNAIPDECEDCNGNGNPDLCDVIVCANCASPQSEDCNLNLYPDDCEGGPLDAQLLVSSTPDQGSLWRQGKNFVQLTFSCPIKEERRPLVAGQVKIVELLPDGGYGSDLSGNFTLDRQGSILTITENEPTPALNHRTWYAIRNAGWPLVACFERQYLLQMGDASGNKFVTNGDLNLINDYIDSGWVGDDSRVDIDGDHYVTVTDLTIANAHLSGLVPKPTGHDEPCRP